MSLIKFCGLSRQEDIEYANILKADYIGFVYAESKRKVTLEKSLFLKKLLDDKIKSVGVFLNNSIDEIINVCKSGAVDLVQVHGDDSEEFIKQVKSLSGLQVIKGCGVKSSDDILKSQHSACDFILLDNSRAGSGVKFDYRFLLEAVDKGFNRPYFLAGGININNIDEALKLNPYCIDISSGIESGGVKNFKLMEDIVKRVRGEGR